MKISSWNMRGAGSGGFKTQLRIHRKRQPGYNCFKGNQSQSKYGPTNNQSLNISNHANILQMFFRGIMAIIVK